MLGADVLRSTPFSIHLPTIALAFAFSCRLSKSSPSTSATVTPTHVLACTFARSGSPCVSASPTARCTFIASRADTPSKRSGIAYSVATPTYSMFGNCTPTMRRYTAFAAGGAKFALPSSTRNMPRLSASDTPSFCASSALILLMTRAARAAPISDPAPLTLSTVASSPLPLRM